MACLIGLCGYTNAYEASLKDMKIAVIKFCAYVDIKGKLQALSLNNDACEFVYTLNFYSNPSELWLRCCISESQPRSSDDKVQCSQLLFSLYAQHHISIQYGNVDEVDFKSKSNVCLFSPAAQSNLMKDNTGRPQEDPNLTRDSKILTLNGSIKNAINPTNQILMKLSKYYQF